MSRRIIEKINTNNSFCEVIKEIISNENILKMKENKQHIDIDCFEHCFVVSYYCYTIAEKFKLDKVSAARGAMLHDFFLNKKKHHLLTHGKTAYINASREFKLNDIERDMIENHMWPLTIKFPQYKETYLLTIVDKYCAIIEFFYSIHRRIIMNLKGRNLPLPNFEKQNS